MNLITIPDAAKMLGVNAETIRRWVRLGELKAWRRPGSGRSLFVERSEIEKRKVPVPVAAKNK